jgi:hypothetical protein
MQVKVSTAVTIIVVCIVGSLLIMRELSWRFEPSLDLTQKIELRDSSGKERVLIIHQQSDSPVDIERHMYQNLQSGITYVSAWLEGSSDTTRFTIKGRYYSEVRPLFISIDSSTQAFLIPNTEHGMPNGWGELLFITPADTLGHFQVISPNINDYDRDGRFEVYDPYVNEYGRLDPTEGKFIPIKDIDTTKFTRY